MKKIIALLFVGSFLFAQRYPALMEYSYLNGCIGNNMNTMANYCVCTLKVIENKYQLNDLLAQLKDPEKKQQIVKWAANQCKDELK